jgi:hypothetical protein
MSITARPESAFAADLTGAPSGATVRCGIRQIPAGTMASALSATGVTETALGGGVSNYTAARTAPSVTSEADVDGPRYQVVWEVAGVESATEDLLVTATYQPSADTIPDVSDVSAILQERVKGQGGNIVTEFDSTTRPTATQVEMIIDLQAPLVLVEFGDLSDTAMICANADEIRAAVRTLIAARVAAVVELSFWPQDAVGHDTAENFWRRIVEIDTPKVVAAARECRLGNIVPGGDGDGGGGIAMRPAFTFNAGPRVGTRPF